MKRIEVKDFATVPGWTVQSAPDHLHRVFRFADFSEAFAFMTRVALLAEVQNHHPAWRNVWNLVEVNLSTHDVNGLTEKDRALAEAINRITPSL